MNAQQRNILIAEFMGFEVVRVGYFTRREGDEDDETDWQVENSDWIDEVGIETVGHYAVNVPDKKWHAWDDVKYHESWDWLMPVGKKIFDWLREQLKNRKPHTCTQGDLIEVDISCAIREYDLHHAHKHIANWITWYNDNKNESPLAKQ